ncbi:hypothetical protein DNTS_034975 [Danionella cerebrum]|uniref:Immunoglobulin V-set domain-containing protein n=1 Tax=Danionella cerebrum TaxID=2873325 RepID=A0A553MT72_9TELE|nr:hypothetical protein DNTS_034975 [Danionella translucida]
MQVVAAPGTKVNIECSTDKWQQFGVYMYKQNWTSEPQELFYYKYDGSLSYKKSDKYKVSVDGKFPALKVTLLNLTAMDIAFYWCEFNKEDKITPGKITWVLKVSLDEKPSTMNIIVIAAVSGLVNVIFICVILKLNVGECMAKRKRRQFSTPSDSVYEEMKRTYSDTQATGRTLINQEYQSIKGLRKP